MRRLKRAGLRLGLSLALFGVLIAACNQGGGATQAAPGASQAANPTNAAPASTAHPTPTKGDPYNYGY